MGVLNLHLTSLKCEKNVLNPLDEISKFNDEKRFGLEEMRHPWIQQCKSMQMFKHNAFYVECFQSVNCCISTCSFTLYCISLKVAV